MIFNKRSTPAGNAGLDNDLVYLDKTMMFFGDAKEVIGEMAGSVDQRSNEAHRRAETISVLYLVTDVNQVG